MWMRLLFSGPRSEVWLLRSRERRQELLLVQRLVAEEESSDRPRGGDKTPREGRGV